MADLAARVGSDEKRLSRTIVRINTIESTSPLATGEHVDESSLPAALVPSEPDAPDAAYEKLETRDRVRAAIQSLPWRERKVIGLYYYGEVTMKQIGAEIGVNESRVSQLHARAIRRLRDALGEMDRSRSPRCAARSSRSRKKPVMAKAALPARRQTAARHGVVLPYKPRRSAAPSRRRCGAQASAAAASAGRRLRGRTTSSTLSVRLSRTARSRSPSRNGLASQRQPLSSRNCSASVPATSPVTKMTRLRQRRRRGRRAPGRTPCRRAAASSDRRSPDRTARSLTLGERLFAVGRAIDDVAASRSASMTAAGQRRLVLDDQNRRARDALERRRSRARGAGAAAASPPVTGSST